MAIPYGSFSTGTTDWRMMISLKTAKTYRLMLYRSGDLDVRVDGVLVGHIPGTSTMDVEGKKIEVRKRTSRIGSYTMKYYRLE